MTWNYEFFTPEEMLSPLGLRQFDKGNLMLDTAFMGRLVAFRKELGKPIYVNYGGLQYRGYRSPHENERVGGTEFSRHVQGKAADITVSSLTSQEVAELASRHGFRGIGIYDNFTHIDTRPGPLTVWDHR
jgi:hypothetical protein